MTIQIYHNPSCSKSRLTLQILNDKNLNPQVIEYLKNTPTAAELKEIFKKLGMTALQVARKHEDEFKQAGLNDDSSDDEVIAAMEKFPKLIERPIVVNGNKAAIGRPPENIRVIFS